MEARLTQASAFSQKPMPSTIQKNIYKISTLKKSVSKQKSNRKKNLTRQSTSKNKKKARRKLANTTGGWKISYIKKGSLFEKMKLKKNDIILLIEGQKVYSKKQAYKLITSFSKKQKKITVFLTRKKRDFLISYKVKSSKTKKTFIISKLQLRSKAQIKKPKSNLQNKIKPTSKNPKVKQSLVPKKHKPLSKNPKVKQSLVPKKYKPHLQLAYVASLNSFVYKQPNFDALKIHSLFSGQKILISKKIFRPSHNFGSFYKIFLFRGKKLVGYVAETDVIPESLNKNKKQSPNPAYKVAKKQMATDKALDVDLIEKMKKKNQKKSKPNTPTSRNPQKRYIGLSLGFASENITALHPEDVYAGIKLSGYDLLISYLNLDINGLASVYDFKFFYFDILATVPIIKAPHFHLLASGGINMSLDQNKTDPVDYGLSGSLALMFPINQKLWLRTEAKINHGARFYSIRYGFFTSLQFGF